MICQVGYYNLIIWLNITIDCCISYFYVRILNYEQNPY